MKKIFLLAIVLSLFSCDEKDITFSPYNAITEETVFNTEADFKNAISGAYAYLVKRGGGSGYGQELLIDSEVATDNVILNLQGRLSNRDGFRYTSTSSNSHFDFYNSAYRSTYMANLVLEQIYKLPAGSGRDNIVGEALFIRALNHLELLRNYAKIPTQSSDAMSSLGVAYITEPDVALRPSRSTVQDGYSKVLSDLNTAKGLISATYVNGRSNRSAVYALLSRVYLYLGQYQNCIDSSNLAISSIPSITLATSAQVYTSATSGLWEDSNVAGVLFKARIDLVDGSVPGVAYSQAVGSTIRSEYVVSKELFDLYTSTDIRKLAYIKTGLFAGNNYNHIVKYDGRGTGTRNLVDIKVLRLEEVYLNKAEAEYRLNGSGLATLDALRSKRYSSFVSPAETGTALLASILKERRLELAFEMDRFYTLKRLGLPVVRSATNGHFADGTGTPAEALSLPAGDFRWQFPIPLEEINYNPNLQQNPGY